MMKKFLSLIRDLTAWNLRRGPRQLLLRRGAGCPEQNRSELSALESGEVLPGLAVHRVDRGRPLRVHPGSRAVESDRCCRAAGGVKIGGEPDVACRQRDRGDKAVSERIVLDDLLDREVASICDKRQHLVAAPLNGRAVGGRGAGGRILTSVDTGKIRLLGGGRGGEQAR